MLKNTYLKGGESVQWTLKLARTQAGLTQKELAKKLDVSTNTYNDYENYKVSMRVDKAVLFSKIVSIPFDDIIFFENNYTSSVV